MSFPVRLGVALLLIARALCAQTIERAESLWRSGDYEGANDAFRALVEAHPKNPDYRARWGRLYFERFQPSDAAKLFQEAGDPIHIIKWKDLYGNLESATDGCEAVANLLEGIVLEHG